MNKDKTLYIIAIGYAKRALESGTRERERMKQYSSVMNEFHVIVFTRASENFPAFQQEDNLFLHATNAKTKVGTLWKAFKIGRSIVKNNIENKWIVTSQDPFETSLVGRAVARARRATHHVQFHGDVFNPLTYKDSFFQKLRIIYGKHVVRHSCCFRVVSERIKRSLVALGVKAQTIFVLPIQADLSSFLEVYKNRIYKKAPVSFLYVGRFSPEKNITILLEAFSEVFKENPDTRLSLVGSGPLQSTIEEQIVRLRIQDGVKIHSWTDSVMGVMAEHDVLCLSSDHEGWGMVLLEAVATGMSVVTTDVGCAGEVIKNEESGLIVSVGDVEAFASALRTYVKDPTLIEKHGRQGHSVAADFYLSKSDYLNKIVESYTSCSD